LAYWEGWDHDFHWEHFYVLFSFLGSRFFFDFVSHSQPFFALHGQVRLSISSMEEKGAP
jgi:hypothetical protein